MASVRPLLIVLHNDFEVPAVAFFRGRFPEHAAASVPVVNELEDCNSPFTPDPECVDGGEYGAGIRGDIRTFYFKIEVGGVKRFYVDSTLAMDAIETWLVPEAFADITCQTVALGPTKMNCFKMINTSSNITFNVSHLEGTTCAILAELTRPSVDASFIKACGTQEILDPNDPTTSHANQSDPHCRLIICPAI